MQGRIEQQFTGRDGRKRGLLDLGVSREALLAGKVGLDGGGAAADLAVRQLAAEGRMLRLRMPLSRRSQLELCHLRVPPGPSIFHNESS